MFFILKSFSGGLGNFEAGTVRPFRPETAQLLEQSGIVTPEGSPAHRAWLAANATAEVAPDADAAPKLETKPEASPELETKPAPAAKTARKAK